MRESIKEVIRTALRIAVDQGGISQSDYESARREVDETPGGDGVERHLEMGGYALVEFLYARAIEAGEAPPRCAREWREVEVAMAECDPEDHERLGDLQSRSHVLGRECRTAARRWSDHHDFAPQWMDVA